MRFYAEPFRTIAFALRNLGWGPAENMPESVSQTWVRDGNLIEVWSDFKQGAFQYDRLICYWWPGEKQQFTTAEMLRHTTK